jgi:hypothetical protein
MFTVKQKGAQQKSMIFRAVLYTIVAFCLATRAAYADSVTLTCSEISMSSPLSGGVTSTNQYNRALQLVINPTANTVTVTNNYGNTYAAGVFPIKISDAAYEWDGNVMYSNGYNHYVLNRYTSEMQATNRAVPGGQVIPTQLNYKCQKLQQQF